LSGLGLVWVFTRRKIAAIGRAEDKSSKGEGCSDIVPEFAGYPKSI